MFQRFYPDEYLDSAYLIDYERLYEEGYRGLLFDIDNTLVPHGAPPDERAGKLFLRLQKAGFRSCFVSNNQFERVSSFCSGLKHALSEQGEDGSKTLFFLQNAHKPSVKGYQKAMALMGTCPENTIFIGDQLFTDIYGANRTGLRSILVKPIHPKEEIQIVLKRYLEKIVLFFYEKERKELKNQ